MYGLVFLYFIFVTLLDNFVLVYYLIDYLFAFPAFKNHLI